MPPAKRVKPSKKPTKKKVNTTSAYKIGTCINDEEKLNICKAKRPPAVQVTKIQFGARKDAQNQTFYFDSLWNRMMTFRLFQTKKFEPFKRFQLIDISIHLQIVTYHNEDKTNTIRIPTIGGNTIITPLISELIIKSYIVELCDRDLAKKKELGVDDLLIDVDLQNIQFKNNIKPIISTETVINCSTCTFTTDEIIICLDLNKMDVCLKNEESDTESAFFEKGNYLFVMFLDYNDFMFKTKKISGQAPTGSLGENLNLATGNTGIPSFIGDGSIESV
ncbi:13747_t:CDS:1 [Ambispora leptoticha]|uniref:13747_t:CDS:1 n=1 Tax=Ambispora leptoticha TaxID=144679 RepID=A0A9N9AGS1_9GLOM|nr:13747_t:CDS:1 [Ambispora leptoticha]